MSCSRLACRCCCFHVALKPPIKFENIVIAWRSSREAIRSVHDAMPLLLAAKKITVFTFAPQSDHSGREPGLLVDHLEQRGVWAKAENWPDTGDMSTISALFACLDTQEADLIVAGAYGHSRLVEDSWGCQPRSPARTVAPALFVALSIGRLLNSGRCLDGRDRRVVGSRLRQVTIDDRNLNRGENA